jgi:hypothetical protein
VVLLSGLLLDICLQAVKTVAMLIVMLRLMLLISHLIISSTISIVG